MATLPDPVRAALLARHVLHLAVVFEGRPHSAPLFYALTDDARLVWVSDPGTLHGRALAIEPRCAATVAPEAPPLDAFDGLQLRGTASAPPGEQAVLRAAFLRAHPAAEGEIASLPGHLFYAFRPSWVRSIRRADHRVTRREWSGPWATS